MEIVRNRWFVRFLIDGYNLMHVTGHLNGRPTRQLQAARNSFLDWLAVIVTVRRCGLRVVFDGQNAPAQSSELDHRGVRVRFAYRETADDVIESLLEKPLPNTLVVSNDSRLREAARRAAVRYWSCEQFLDWVVTVPPAPPNPSQDADKPIALTAAEQAELLKVFEQPRWRR
jgi:uncharacterized protein